jgi:hypothetical protein
VDPGHEEDPTLDRTLGTGFAGVLAGISLKKNIYCLLTFTSYKPTNMSLITVNKRRNCFCKNRKLQECI